MKTTSKNKGNGIYADVSGNRPPFKSQSINNFYEIDISQPTPSESLSVPLFSLEYYYFLSLQGSASYKTEGGIKSLYLNGRDGYAEFPAVDFRKISFSISIRFKTPDVHILGHLISDWSSPWRFRVFIFGTTVQVVLRRSGDVQFLLRLVSNRLVAFETLYTTTGAKGTSSAFKR